MNDLTEQWKKGELPSGWYYIKDENGVIYAAENCLNYDSLNDKGYTAFYYAETEISEILAPVPSYGNWKKTYECEVFENEENTKLKELLKECRTILDYAKDFAYHQPCCKCIAKIDQALGEDK